MNEINSDKLAQSVVTPATNVYHNINTLNLVDRDLRNEKYRLLLDIYKRCLTVTYEGEKGSETFSHSEANTLVELLDQVERFSAKCIRKYGIGKLTVVLLNKPYVRNLEWHNRAKDWRFVSEDHAVLPEVYKEIYDALGLGCPPWSYDAKRHTSSLNTALVSMGVPDVLESEIQIDITRTVREVVDDRVQLAVEPTKTYYYTASRLGKIASLTRSWMRADWLLGKGPYLHEVRFDIHIGGTLMIRQYVFRIGNDDTGIEWMSRAIRVK